MSELEPLVISLAGTVLTTAWGLPAMWLVWGAKARCPLRWPLLFGATSMTSYIVLNDPRWVPEHVTDAHVALVVLILGVLLAIGLFGLVVERYELDPPQSQLRALIGRL